MLLTHTKTEVTVKQLTEMLKEIKLKIESNAKLQDGKL